MPKVTHVVTNIFTVVVWKHCFVSIENRLILPNEKGNLYRRSDVCTDSWRRWEKEAQQGEVKTGLCVVLRDDWIDSEMCTLREWKGRGIPFERKDGFHFGYVGSEEPVRHWSVSLVGSYVSNSQVRIWAWRSHFGGWLPIRWPLQGWNHIWDEEIEFGTLRSINIWKQMMRRSVQDNSLVAYILFVVDHNLWA